jgi:nucleoside-diphosphate-sugar epimerase
MNFTVFGGRGFVGNALCEHLRNQGHEVFVPARDASDVAGRNLNHVIYAIGLTGDFRTRIFETVDAHVCLLGRSLRNAHFESWLYLSSTRIYAGLVGDSAREDAALTVLPDADGIYNLSKLTGESICLSQPFRKVRVVRLANVYGPGQGKETFLGMLLDDIARGRDILIREAPTSSKDYIALEDVCWLLERIALHGSHRIYNVASGKSVCHVDLANALSAASTRSVAFAKGAQHRSFPPIDISRVVEEFGFRPRPLLEQLRRLIAISGLRHS